MNANPAALTATASSLRAMSYLYSVMNLPSYAYVTPAASYERPTEEDLCRFESEGGNCGRDQSWGE